MTHDFPYENGPVKLTEDGQRAGRWLMSQGVFGSFTADDLTVTVDLLGDLIFFFSMPLSDVIDQLDRFTDPALLLEGLYGSHVLVQVPEAFPYAGLSISVNCLVDHLNEFSPHVGIDRGKP